MMKGTPMMPLLALTAVNVILIIYSIYRWRSNCRLEATFKHILRPGQSWSTGPKLPPFSPDVLRSIRRHPAYRPRR